MNYGDAKISTFAERVKAYPCRCPGQPFDDPEARAALLDGVRKHHGEVELIEMDNHINDPAFAETVAKKLIELMTQNG